MPTAPDLTLYHFPGCPYCQRVRKALATLQVSVNEVDIHRSADAQAELVRHTGGSTVPVLRIADGGSERWMPESMTIVRYLYKRFGRGRRPPLFAMLTPTHKLVLGGALVWMVWRLVGG